MTTTRENAHGDRPGALRSQAIMEIQTRQAQRLVYGRRPEGDKPTIVGLLRFATMLRPMWTGAAADDPYADWWLVQVERELLQGREHLEALREHVDRLLKSAPAVDVKVAQSLEPVRVDLNFSSPYAFMGAYLLADYDALVRAILTGRHVGLLDRNTAEKLLHEGGRAVRRAYSVAQGYRYLAVTREDVRQGTAKGRRAKEMLGELPQEVLEGGLRAAHAPDIRHREEKRGTEPVDGAADPAGGEGPGEEGGEEEDSTAGLRQLTAQGA